MIFFVIRFQWKNKRKRRVSFFVRQEKRKFSSFRKMFISIFNQFFRWKTLPKASQIVRSHLQQRNYPPWTSFFISQFDCLNDQFGQTHFEFDVDGRNYHILRTGCFPFIKYHCTKRTKSNDLTFENRLFTILKCFNFGLPTLMYGLVSIFLIRHVELVQINNRMSPTKIYFLLKENSGASF